MRRSFVTEMVPPEDLPNSVVLYSTIVNLSRIFWPSLAGCLLVVSVGYGWCFAIDAASYVAVIASLLMMRPSELHRQPLGSRSQGAIREGLRYAWSVPTLRVSFAMFAVVTLLAYNFNVTLPLFVTRGLGAGEGTFTMLYSVLSAGSVVSALAIAHRTRVSIRHLTQAVVLFGAALLLLSVTWPLTAAPAAFPRRCHESRV
ncbi:MAG: MFS transporter [Vicinamibacterales bacterium]